MEASIAGQELPGGTIPSLTRLPSPYTYPPNPFGAEFGGLQLARRCAFEPGHFCMGNVQVGRPTRKHVTSIPPGCGHSWDSGLSSWPATAGRTGEYWRGCPGGDGWRPTARERPGFIRTRSESSEAFSKFAGRTTPAVTLPSQIRVYIYIHIYIYLWVKSDIRLELRAINLRSSRETARDRIPMIERFSDS
jgi:hypothetical protein